MLSNRGQTGAVKPPSRLGLPPYYTQYEEHFSEMSSDNEESETAAQLDASEPPPKRARHTTRRSVVPSMTTATLSEDNISTPWVSNAATTKAKTKTKPKPPTSKTTVSKPQTAKSKSNSTMDVTSSVAANSTASVASKNKKLRAKNKVTDNATTSEAKSMRWTIDLTALAIEARFMNKQILKKFASKNSDTKAVRAMWEDTITVFQQRALMEHAWGSDSPRDLTVKQFKNKLNTIRAAYKLKRTRYLATGNIVQENNSSSDDAEENPRLKRTCPEMPLDYLLEQADDAESSISETSATGRTLTCDPLKVHPTYRKEFSVELAALWPLLCDVFSHHPGCTGEAITESGTSTRPSVPSSGESENDQEDVSDAACSDTPSEARAKAKKRPRQKRRELREASG